MLPTESYFVSGFDASRINELGIKKSLNRQAFANIDIPDYLNKIQHRALLMHISRSSEYVYVVYPGDKKNDDMPRHDFIPLVYPQLTDVSNLLLISDLFEEFEVLAKNNPEVLPYLATVLCRMAFMVDHKEGHYSLDSGEYDLETQSYYPLQNMDFQFFKLELNPEILRYFNTRCDKIRGMTPEAFFQFVDLIAQNEDLHYGVVKKDNTWSSGKKESSKGRTNFLLTCVRAIGVLLGHVPFSAFFKDYSAQNKISPATDEEVKAITKGMFTLTGF